MRTFATHVMERRYKIFAKCSAHYLCSQWEIIGINLTGHVASINNNFAY